MKAYKASACMLFYIRYKNIDEIRRAGGGGADELAEDGNNEIVG